MKSLASNVKKIIQITVSSILILVTICVLPVIHVNANNYEYALFPMDYLNISQGVNGSFSHKGCNALDLCGKDRGIDNVKAPFTCIVKRKYTDSYGGVTVWIQSQNKVFYADGTLDYMTILFIHDNDTSDLYVGQVIPQGTIFYQEGTAGHATGNHVHMECGRGQFTGTGWYKNSSGVWTINNTITPWSALTVSDSVIRINDYGYAWQNHIHSYNKKTFMCKCGAFDPNSLKSTKNLSNVQYIVTKNDAIDHTGPYGDCKSVNKYSKDTVVTAVQEVVNGYGKTWYKLSNGNYIYSEYVKKLPAPKWATIKANRTEMTVGETISFEFNSDNANSYTIGIDCNNNRVLTETVGNNKIFSYTCTQAGKYSAYISASNSAGGLDSSRVYWTVNEKEITVYTITYNANGGSGGPSSQQKNKGQSLTISSEFPERFGYSFVGWSTSSTSDKAQYIPGSTFSKDADTTLYAVWSSMIELSSKLGKKTGALEFPYAGKCKYYKITPAKDGSYRFEIADSSDVQLTIMNSSGGAIGRFDNYGTSNTFYIDMDFKAGETYYIKIEGKKAGTINYDFRKIYTLTYDTQGGTDGPLKQIKLFDVDINTSSKIPSREGYTFLGWSLSPDSTEVKIKSGSIMKYTGNHDDILYAVWEKNAHTHNWEWKTEEPTCTQNGKKYQICECGETQNVTYLPYSHKFGEWVVVDRETKYPFTITQQRTCSVCGETETSLIVSTPSSPDEILYGDVNSDGTIDGLDATALLQYLAEWEVDIDFYAADVNADGVIDGLDATLLLQYLAEWDVILGSNK